MSDSIGDALREPVARADKAVPSASSPSIPVALQPIAAAATHYDAEWWAEIDGQLAGQILGRRVLVVGPATDYEATGFAGRGAEHVLVCTTPEAGEPSGPQASGPEAGVEFERLEWDELEPAGQGNFGIVCCRDLLHRVREPMALLSVLRRMTADDGTLLIGSMMLADPERSEYLRFIPDRHGGDPGWWFVPGRLAFRWLVQTAGFEVQAAFGEQEGPGDEFPLVSGYLRATPR